MYAKEGWQIRALMMHKVPEAPCGHCLLWACRQATRAQRG